MISDIKINSDSKINVDFAFETALKKEKYSSEKFECFVKNILPEYNYILEFPVKVSGNAKYKLLAAYIRADGKELAMDYIESGKPFTTVPGTVAISFEVVAYSRDGGSVYAKGGVLSPVGKAEKREVVIAAVADAYRGARTFEKNMSNALEIIDEIAKEKPDLVALSEAFYGRQVKLPIEKRAITLDSEPVKALLAKAKEYRTYICFSVHAYNEDGNIQNVAVLADRNGEIAGVYAKTHLTIGEYEMGMEPGTEPVVFETDFGKVGVCICWDLFFPEFVRRYHLEDVDIIVNPTAGFDAARTVERAKESGAYILVSGTKRHEHSRVVDSVGRVLDKGSPEKRYAVAKVDLNKEEYVWYLSSDSYSTRKNIFKNERVPELYK